MDSAHAYNRRSSEGTKVQLNEMLQNTRRSLLEVMLKGEIRESQVNDDRLERLLKNLGSGETTKNLTRELNAHLIRYYRQRMR